MQHNIYTNTPPLSSSIATVLPLSKCIVAVDFDGTCVTHEYPKMGKDVGAVPVLQRIVREGGRLILWTMRSGKDLDAAVQWFVDNNIKLYGVQKNPQQDEWTNSPKAYATIYIDDAALGCPLTYESGVKRPYVNWWVVAGMLWPDENHGEFPMRKTLRELGQAFDRQSDEFWPLLESFQRQVIEAMGEPAKVGPESDADAPGKLLKELIAIEPRAADREWRRANLYKIIEAEG